MRQGLLLFLPLGPLSANAMEEHLHALLPGTFSESLANLCSPALEAICSFSEELVRMLTLNGQLILYHGVWQTTRVIGLELPQSITLAVEQRLQGLSATCRELLRVASLWTHIPSTSVGNGYRSVCGWRKHSIIHRRSDAGSCNRDVACGHYLLG